MEQIVSHPYTPNWDMMAFSSCSPILIGNLKAELTDVRAISKPEVRSHSTTIASEAEAANLTVTGLGQI